MHLPISTNILNETKVFIINRARWTIGRFCLLQRLNTRPTNQAFAKFAFLRILVSKSFAYRAHVVEEWPVSKGDRSRKSILFAIILFQVRVGEINLKRLAFTSLAQRGEIVFNAEVGSIHMEIVLF